MTTHDTSPGAVERKPTRAEINAMRLKAFRSNLDADKMDYYKACSGWFQDEDFRELDRAAERDALRAEALDWRGQAGELSDLVKALRADNDRLRAELEQRDTACAEWTEVSQENYQRAKKAEAAIQEAHDSMESGRDSDAWAVLRHARAALDAKP